MTQRLDYTAIAPAGIKALGSVYGYIMQSGLPRLLVNLVYLRTSQINGCAYCIDMHSRDLIKEGLAVEKLVLVQAWREAGSLFDTRERSALAWAETVTRVADTAVPDADFQAASASPIGVLGGPWKNGQISSAMRRQSAVADRSPSRANRPRLIRCRIT